MKRFLSIITICLLAFGSLFAQDVNFTAKAKSVVSEGQNFYLQYEMNKKGRNLQLPDMGEFRILQGPSRQTSSSTRVINNNVTHSYTFTYTYVVKAPDQGSYTIPPATVEIDGTTYKSNRLTINVVKSATQSNTQSRQPTSRSGNRQTTGSAGGDPFARLNINKSSVYQGEPIYASLKLYLPDHNLAGFEDVSFPDFSGFWSEKFNMPEQIRLKTEAYNGKTYYTAELGSWILYPQRNGKLSIGSGEYGLVLRERVQGGGSGSIFDSFFGRYENIRKTVKNQEVSVNVKPLPNGKPGSFNGGVGDFSVQTALSHNSIDVNSAFNLSIKISGSGNLNLLDEPELNLPEVFEVYDPKVNTNFSQTINGSSGYIEYDYTIIPRYPGTHKLKDIRLSWFDPGAGKYQTYRSGGMEIFVRRTADYEEGEPAAQTGSRSQVQEIATDIRFLKDIKSAFDKQDIYNTPVFWLAYIVPFVILGVIVFLRRKQIRARQDVARLRNRKANKIAMSRLKRARKLMKAGDNAFYNETIKALWGYVADKLDMDTANLSRDNVAEGLKKRNLSDEMIEKLLNIIDKCEYAHFAPDSEETEPSRIYKYAISLITKLEQKL
jgi:hypothetical protein